MSEYCPYFENGCPVPLDVRETAGNPCELATGNEICGPLLAYTSLEGSFSDLEKLDKKRPIVATFKITTVPFSHAKNPEIPKQWVGVELPVRDLETVKNRGKVNVTAMDAVFCLVMNGRYEAAEHFRSEADLSPFEAPLEFRWNFKLSEGEITEIPTISTRDWYGAGIDPRTRKYLDDHFEPDDLCGPSAAIIQDGQLMYTRIVD